MRILGCGHPDRSDDGAGVFVARRLRELGLDARELSGEPLALIEAWSDCSDVIVVDAVVTGAAPGTITVWDAASLRLPPSSFGCSTHGFGLPQAIDLARVLGRVPAKLTFYGIEARSFEPGGPLSPEVDAAVKNLTDQFRTER